MNKLTNYEIDIIDHYVIRNNLPTMNFIVFRNVLDCALPTWRSEQLCGEFFVDDSGRSVYEQYLNFNSSDNKINKHVFSKSTL